MMNGKARASGAGPPRGGFEIRGISGGGGRRPDEAARPARHV